MDNIRTILADLPYSVKAYTIYKDDFYTIVLNSKLSYEQNIESYNHELSHIGNKDFYNKINVGMIEIKSHK